MTEASVGKSETCRAPEVTDPEDLTRLNGDVPN